MVRITKIMQPKHSESLSQFIREFRDSACSVDLPHLPQHLDTFPSLWPFLRGDLYHWIPLLNRFDDILDRFCKTYKLDEGPQTMDFACALLESGAEDTDKASQEGLNLEQLGFAKDGDRELIESILRFSRMLLLNCGNRSIYASSSHLNNLLQSTSLSLLATTLSLASELAQRYQATLKRMNMHTRHVNAAVLANHYNFDLDRVLQLSLPFSKTTSLQADASPPHTPVTPTAKGKEKAYFNTPATPQKSSTAVIHANDLVSIVKGGNGVSSSPNNSAAKSENFSEASWAEWGDVKVTYYPKPAQDPDSTSTPRALVAGAPTTPTTPTPVRRASNLGPQGPRPHRQTHQEEAQSPTPRAATFPTTMEEPPKPNFRVIEISSSRLRTSGLHNTLRANMSGLPREVQYELLTKARAAVALTSSIETRRQLLAVRLLAITNLAYIHPESTFHTTVLKQDSEEPRRLQLVYQLAELIHPPAEGVVPVPRELQTLAFTALNALSQHQSRFQDVCAALNTNVNHGVLLYVVRKVVAEMSGDDVGDKVTDDDEWRDALLTLLSNLSINPRTGAELVTAGLIPIFVEVLGLRSSIAERYHPTILTFLDTIMYSARDAFQTLVSADGLDAVSKLIIFEVNTAFDDSNSGKRFPLKYCSSSVDYEIPFFRQQTLKWLFKFIHHMMTAAGGYGGNYDRLLRNLIDSFPLLESLNKVINQGTTYGAIVWTSAVSILNDFINNEPTSYAIIAEAGLSKTFLEYVINREFEMPFEKKKSETPAAEATDSADPESSPSPQYDLDDSDDEPPHDENERPTLEQIENTRRLPGVGVLANSEVINIIPQAFGAICLNNAGMKMLQVSGAIASFFEIFESPQHVRCMDNNKDLPSNLGGTFDELVRHHPQLKPSIMNAIIVMVARVGALCRAKSKRNKLGAKLWTTNQAGESIVADLATIGAIENSSKEKGKGINNESDVEMQDVDSKPPVSESRKYPRYAYDDFSDHSRIPEVSMTHYIEAVASFLSAMFSNPSVRSDFSAKGGIEFVLDLAESPCLDHDFADEPANRALQSVVALFAESKPHLTMPSLLRRAQAAADELSQFGSYSEKGSFFAPFVDDAAQRSADVELLANGTSFAKAFVNIHSLVGTLNSCFQTSVFNHRSASTNFSQLNVADHYVRLVHSLGQLLGASLREEIYLKSFFRTATVGIPAISEVPGFVPSPATVENQAGTSQAGTSQAGTSQAGTSQAGTSQIEPPASSSTPGASLPTPASVNPTTDTKHNALPKSGQEVAYAKNVQTLRYLLGKMSRTISPFFQTLGKGLFVKRNTDQYQKQSLVIIAEALASSILAQLTPEGPNLIQTYGYWIGVLHVLHDMLIDISRHNERPIQTITLVLQAFKDQGGFDKVNHILDVFTNEIRSSTLQETDKSSDDYLRYELATAGTKHILTIYSRLVNGKNVVESIQTVSMTSRGERDRSRSDYFSPPQFLVELRMAVLPTIRRLWGSDLIEKGSSQISEKLIEVIRSITNADSEFNAVKRSDKAIAATKPHRKSFKPNSESLATLDSHGYDVELATEALFRCNNSLVYALEYCREAQHFPSGRNPVPEGEIVSVATANGTSRPRTGTSTGTATPDDDGNRMQRLFDPPPVPEDGALSEQNISNMLSQITGSQSQSAAETASTQAAQPVAEEPQRKQVTVDDLNEERDAIRDNLIDKCLDVINAHGEVTFEVADLITTAVNKSNDPPQQRKAVGETLVVALLSFAGEEDLKTSGKKIAAYAHLLALMLQDKQFYSAAVAELKDNDSLATLLAFVKLPPGHSADEPSPWVSQILLIIELLLSEDSKPRKTSWSPPKDAFEEIEPPVLEITEPVVSDDEREQLLEAILDILPRIGKDESLALSVLRILVILTRKRSVAQSMGEKKNIQRLFVMAKQLAGASSTRIQSPLMIILRHIIEDDDTIKQIMRADIKSYFDNGRHQRNIDHTAYLRGLAHTAVRSPELFVEVTNEMVMYTRWSYHSPDVPHRHNSLALKDTSRDAWPKILEDPAHPPAQATEANPTQDLKPSTEARDSSMPDVPKVGSLLSAESKLPVVENPDGVIHFLLCELLNYRDVEDKDPSPPTTTTPEKAETQTQPSGDVTMGGVSSAAAPLPTPTVAPAAEVKDNKIAKPAGKQEFKVEDHPIFIYRCFILQCLTELLSSYNRTKIEFINFKRSSPPQAMTPSKPRSSVVNYLLFDIIPIGTLDHAETPNLRKKFVTSSWADSVLTALLSKTGEFPIVKGKEPFDSENEPDLLFVRRFVLENILKAYKEASLSTEALDIKYSRMLSLADLMNHIMSGKDNAGVFDTALAHVSQKQLRRIMYEKGYVAALTASIADIDLNFPGAKRAVKYILRPLKTLTSTAVALSELELISSAPGQHEEEEIESASSISDAEDQREETPDLFRNSTLGMFEPGREEDSSSESDDDDEEMYEGEYDEEMDYEEDIGEDEDNISDEDEEIEGMGPIEGLSGDHGVDVEVIMNDGEEDDDGSSGDDDEDDEDDDEDDEDDDEDEDSDDADHRVEIIDEVGNIQHIVEDEDMDEWESEDGHDEVDEEDYEGAAADQEEAHAHGINDVDGALGQLLRSLGGGGEGAVDILERMEVEALEEGEQDPVTGEYIDDVDDEEDEDDVDDMEEEEMMFDQYPMDGPGPPLGWQDEVDPPMVIHRRPRGAFPPFPVFAGGRGDPLGGTSRPPSDLAESVAEVERLATMVNLLRSFQEFLQPGTRTNPDAVPDYRPSYRSHRPNAPVPRSADDGVNPLLQRGTPNAPSRDGPNRPTAMRTWLQAMGGPGAEILEMGLGGRPFGESPATAALLDEVIRSLPPMPGHIARHGGAALQFHITTAPGHELPRDIQMMLGGRPRFETRRDPSEPGSAAFFAPQSTTARWLEEAKLLFGPTFAEQASEIANAILAVLVPPAVEADKTARAAEEERKRKADEEAKKKAEEERIVREAKEAEEKAVREAKEAEEREAAEKAAAEALATKNAEAESATTADDGAEGNSSLPDAMEGVETGTDTNTTTDQAAVPAADRPRVTTMIRGSPFDITDLGIDAAFLAELPEEIREEVIMSAVADRRSQAAATGAQPSDIDQEFLDALPDDIRAEIMAQERQDRRRRQREEQSRAAAAANGNAPQMEMDAASILATLDPVLRNQVLLEQDDDTLAMLPPDLAEQARAAMRSHGHVRQPGFPRRVGGPPPPGEREVNPPRPARRPIVQMLDKSGVATLLRLMFVFQQGSVRGTLNSVLQNVSENRHNRNEVLSTLLNVLQDGSIDASAVERSFAHLSLRARQPKDAQPKTPVPLRRAFTGPNAINQTTLEASPLLVVQQCLTTLVYLNQANPHISAFFLTEHDIGTGLKRSLSRKGKGKENKAAKYALNSLLGLLDRELIMESSSVMEALSTLLNMVTGPLQTLQRRQNEVAEAKKTEDSNPASEPAAPAPATTSNTEQPTSTENATEVPSTEPAPAETGNPAEGGDSPEVAKADPAPKEPEKKQRPIIPPVVPEQNLQLVINIFVARECSSKTFRETLSTIKNLSAIPGAKAVFGRELISKAQGLGEIILTDLKELLPQIQKATTGTEIQGVALAKFSPGGSDQNKLLRVLTALDHLFDPKREKKDKPTETELEGETSQLVEKQDLLSTLYENSTFGPMWEMLSSCLAAIRQREHMMNVATILLPLIEALMVVCKNTTIKEAPLARSQLGKEMMLTSPPPESRMESLFFTFTEEHRKILNDLVRHTPKLMSGTFSLLVKNPKVLEFDNKRNYFSRSIHNKAPNSRQQFPPLQLSVRRDQVFHDSFKSLYFQTGDQMKYGKLSIRFHGEEGVDAGGVTREWFQVLSRQMFDPGYALFIPVSSDRTTFHPNQLSSINEEHLMFFKFIGRIIGKALYEGRVLDCHFSRAVYKRILGKAVSVKDMESLDPDYYKSLIWMLENDITDIITETFSVDNDKFGVVETIDFIPNGRNVPVTEDNKHEYVRLMVEWKLTGSVKEQLDEFLKGFHEIIPAELVAIFNEQELELLISGLPEIDVDDWKGNTELHNYNGSSPQIQWFWRAVRSFDKEERAKLLQFVTGTSKVPLNGFKELEGMNGFSRFNIHRDYGNKDRLPSSHTCFNQLDLPEYESYEALRQQVLTAITAGSEYFGFA